MQPRVPRIIGITLASTLAVLLASCGTDTTAPPSNLLQSAFDQIAPISGNRVHRAANGVAFIINHREGTLTATGRKPVRLSREVISRLEKDFDLMSVVETRRAHFKAQPDYQRLTHQTQARGALLRVSAVDRSPAFSTATGANGFASPIAPRMSAAIFDGMDESGISCLEIAQAIYAEQPIYDHALRQLDEALFEVSQAGTRDDGVWDWEDYAAALLVEVAEWNYQVELNKMNFLAVLYNSYNCWSNDWTDASVSSGGGGGGGGGGSQCYESYGTIEISYDGGMTWQDLWTGWYSVCGEMQA